MCDSQYILDKYVGVLLEKKTKKTGARILKAQTSLKENI